MTAAQAYNSRLGAPQQDFSGANGDAKYKAYLAQQVLQDAQHRSDQVFSEYMKYQQQLGAVMTKLSKLNFKEIDYEKVLELMREGLKLLGEIRTQWSKLTQFFAMIAVRAEVTMKETLVPFLEYAHELEEMNDSPIHLTAEDRDFFLSTMVMQAQDIERSTYFLYTVSSTYVSVSQRYLLDKLAGLSKMLTAKNDNERNQLLASLSSDAASANQEIMDYSKRRRLEYKENLQVQIDAMKNTVHLLGPVSGEDQEAASDGFDLLHGEF
jgi:hypothetical protein